MVTWHYHGLEITLVVSSHSNWITRNYHLSVFDRITSNIMYGSTYTDKVRIVRVWSGTPYYYKYQQRQD